MLPTPDEVRRWLTQQNIYRVIDNIKGYAFVFGNLEWGYVLTDDKYLKEIWNKAIHMSQNSSFGDVSLYYNGKLIRSMNNADRKILENHLTQYKYKVTKYESNRNQ